MSQSPMSITQLVHTEDPDVQMAAHVLGNMKKGKILFRNHLYHLC